MLSVKQVEALRAIILILFYCSYNLKEDNFATLREYNDYLEEVESISMYYVYFPYTPSCVLCGLYIIYVELVCTIVEFSVLLLKRSVCGCAEAVLLESSDCVLY